MNLKGQKLLPWAIGAFFCLFYLSFHSTFYNFDGVACAIAIELGDFRHLAHGNHLLYGVVGWLFDRLWRFFGYSGPALLALQTLDSLLGGIGVGIFSYLLVSLKFPRPLAWLCAMGLGICQAYWLWSLEAQVYIFGAFFILLAATEALSENPRPWRLGLLHGLAVLGHIGHIMFLPAAIHQLWKPAHSGKPTGTYLLSLAVCVSTAYVAAAALLVHPDSYEACRVWLLGSAALTLDKSFVWFGGYSWEHLRNWALMTLHIFSDPVPLLDQFRLLGQTLALAALGAAGAALLRPHVKTTIFSMFWIFSYAILYSSWQPFTIVYRITDLIPFWILIATAIEKTPKAWPWLAAWVLGTGLLNWKTSIQPHTDPQNNKEYQEALWISELSPPEAWIVVHGRAQVYIPYFAHRRPINMRYYENHLQALKDRLNTLSKAGEKVYISSDIIRAGGWEDFFLDYGLEQSARKQGMVLWRLNPGIPGRKKYRRETNAQLQAPHTSIGVVGRQKGTARQRENPRGGGGRN
jgi:hypothetical protein